MKMVWVILLSMPASAQPSLFAPESGLEPSKQQRSGTFTDNLRLPIHRWFRYSAGFSAQWAEELIRQESPSLVFDPFAGCGTTLLAASAAGVASFGYEGHPFVARIAKSKTFWTESVVEFLSAAKELQHHAQTATAQPETIPELLNACYTPQTLQKLFALRQAHTVFAPTVKLEIAELLWLALTSILRVCSHVGTAQWQYVLPKKSKASSKDPFLAFEQKVIEMAKDMLLFQAANIQIQPSVYGKDARFCFEQQQQNQVDLVVTSPPYPNNYDYADATRLEMVFWQEIKGWGDLQKTVRQFIVRSSSQHASAEKLKLEELLEHPHLQPILPELSQVCAELAAVRLTKGGKKAYHTMIAAYFIDLARVLDNLRLVCKKDAKMCWVIGDSAPYGVHVPVNRWLEHLAQASGFEPMAFEKLRDRNTKWRNRKHQVPLLEGRLWMKG
jgi:DNA modification methylase